MRQLAQTCEAVAATTKKLQKIAIVADDLAQLPAAEAAAAAIFLSGRVFPAWEEMTLQVGGSTLWRVVAELSGQSESALATSYRKHGDLGAIAAEVLPDRPSSDLSVVAVADIFRQIAAARGAAAKTVLLKDLLSRVSPLQAKYIIKIITGDLRIGLKESLVEESIAKAFGGTLAEVQRANMLLGDLGETVQLAASGRLAEAKMRMFHPIGFMLASPVESPEQALEYFTDAAVEDKYDGIRAQAHISGGEVKLFSRTRDEITASFPELLPALAGLSGDAILDGEIVAWQYPPNPSEALPVVDEPLSEEGEQKATRLGQARPFTVLQQRLGRKKVSDKMLREAPVAFIAFDVLYAGGQLLIDLPLTRRAEILDPLLENLPEPIAKSDTRAQSTLGFAAEQDSPAIVARAIRAPVFRASSPDQLELLFAAAQERGNEGLMIKDLNSSYLPGKRGKWWLKMKRELATLDVVVTAVEYGHGRRVSVLSDYTFAVQDGDRLVNIGKAYSGLTDAEIAEMTQWFLEHTIEDQGFRRTVEPKIVLEVAFNNMMKSDRHESGYALRFPRIVRLRPDKAAEDADTIETAREIFERQSKS